MSKLLMAFLLLTTLAAAGIRAGVTQAATATSPGDVELARLSWMSGVWTGTSGQVEIEEYWTAPKGGLMLGLHRDWLPESERATFEYLRIEARETGVFYVASPGGKPSTDFALVEATDHRVVFANPAHDFPRRIVYRLDESGMLVARVDGGEEDPGTALEWRWTRGKL